MIPYGRQDIDEHDIQSVVEVLRSEWLTQGPALERFEQEVAGYCGVRYAVAVSNATAALHISCIAAGLGRGDRLWTSPNTFVASANCALYCDAAPDFVDIDPNSFNLSADAMAVKLAKAERGGTLPKVVIPVHFAGQSADMARIAELAQRYRFTVIEDASHAIGGRYRDEPIGNCRYSDMVVFSFHPVKIVTTGEGGMVLTNRKDLYDKLLLLRSHGITRNPALMDKQPDGAWYYQQVALGFNYRMTDIQAALGSSQMRRLDTFVARRTELADRYDRLLTDLPLQVPSRDPQSRSAFHLYPVRVRDDAPKSRGQVFEHMRQAGVAVNLHYIPVHTQPYYRTLGFRDGDFPAAEAYYRQAISLPLYYRLEEAQQDRVVQALKEVLT